MFNRGQIVRGRRQTYELEELIRIGGQGQAFYGRCKADASRVVVKLFNKGQANDAMRKRLDLLSRTKLVDHCESLVGPVDIIDTASCLGHVSPVAPGISLMKILDGEVTLEWLIALHIGIAVSHSFAVAEGVGIAHGDPNPENVLVELNAVPCRISVIDWDNATSFGLQLPPSPMRGAVLYMAPELRGHDAPSALSDRFTLAVLIHQLLLGVHPTRPLASTAAAFEKAVASGRWQFDPTQPAANLFVAGIPRGLLNTRLCGLFRRGLSATPNDRPTPLEWRDSLTDILFSTAACPNCGQPDILDDAKHLCPHCRVGYPCIALQSEHGRVICESATTVIGRDHFGDDMSVSKRHAVFTRRGPETRIQDLSQNGTYRRAPSGWIRLPSSQQFDHQPLVQTGDMLRLGAVEVQVVSWHEGEATPGAPKAG